jgi:hypothetical protein
VRPVELALPDLSKLIGDEWKKLSENQKGVSDITLLMISLGLERKSEGVPT